MAEAELVRAIVTADGRTKANFSDNTVVVLDATATTFTVCCPDGSQQRQMSCYVVSRYEAKLAVALEFRNSLVDEPFYCKALLRLGKEPFDTGFPIRQAAWPSTTKKAISEGLLSVKEDDTCTLRSYGQRGIATAHQLRGKLGSENVRSGTGDRPLRTLLPKSRDGASAAGWKPVALRSWWMECTTSLFPTDAVVAFEWRPEAMYCFDASEAEVQVVVHADGSMLCSFQGGKFFRHLKVKAPEQDEAVYAAGSAPRSIRGPDGSRDYDIQPVVAHAGVFREVAARVSRQQSLPAPDSSRPPLGHLHSRGSTQGSTGLADLSTSVRELREEPGLGRFTSYEDGRVRAVFVDRTILELDGAQQEARLTLRDASTLTVTTANPVGVEVYVTAALRFAAWSFSTPQQRVEADRMARALREEELRTARMQDVLSWTISGKVPSPTAPPQPGAGAEASYDAEGNASRTRRPSASCHEAIVDMQRPQDISALVEQYLSSNSALLERLGETL